MAGSESTGDSNTGASAQDSEDFSAMATFRRLDKLREYGKKIKDTSKKLPKYDTSKPVYENEPTGRLDTQLWPNRKLKKQK